MFELHSCSTRSFIICLCNIIIFCKVYFIYYFILFHRKRDIEKYDEFLDCKNVKKEKFEDFSDITKLRNCCIAFLILNIIAQGIDQIEKFFDFAGKYIEEEEKEEKEKNNYSK